MQGGSEVEKTPVRHAWNRKLQKSVGSALFACLGEKRGRKRLGGKGVQVALSLCPFFLASEYESPRVMGG